MTSTAINALATITRQIKAVIGDVWVDHEQYPRDRLEVAITINIDLSYTSIIAKTSVQLEFVHSTPRIAMGIVSRNFRTCVYAHAINSCPRLCLCEDIVCAG